MWVAQSFEFDCGKKWEGRFFTPQWLLALGRFVSFRTFEFFNFQVLRDLDLVVQCHNMPNGYFLSIEPPLRFASDFHVGSFPVVVGRGGGVTGEYFDILGFL